MKRIESKREVIDYKYEAMDGTQFEDKDECLAYERSAKGVIKGRVRKLVINEGNECGLLNTGNDENTVWVVKPKTDADVDAIKQLYNVYGGRTEYLPFLDDQVGKVVLLTFSYDDEDMWLDTFEALTKRIMGEE